MILGLPAWLFWVALSIFCALSLFAGMGACAFFTRGRPL